MRVMAIALGGCLRAEPAYGITEDTGGHITYILGAMRALARRKDITEARIVTRLFDAPELGAIHARPHEQVAPNLFIDRIDSGNRDYLSKERLAADVPAFADALIAHIRGSGNRPDIIHAHFSDAADVALRIRDALGLPFVYTAHSLAMDKAAVLGVDMADDALAERIAFEDRAIGGADAVVGSSRDECERQLVAYPSANETRIHRIRPGIDQRQASEADRQGARDLIAPFLRDPDRPLVLAIARPVAKKNLAGLVDAFAANSVLREKANLVILPGLRQSIETGEAEQVGVMRDLVDRIDRNDLHGKAAWPRHHTGAQVRGLYSLAAQSGGVFVNPAKTEPFGLTVLEAAVQGCPVVATRHGGPADILAEIGHGATVDPDNTGAIGNAIEHLLTDRDRWETASRNASTRIGAVQWDRYAAGFAHVAREVLAMREAAAKPAALPFSRARSSGRRLLLCDIDNTLTGCRVAARRFADYLSARRDIVFGVATGRSLVEARRLIREWDLPTPAVWVTSVGTEIHWQSASGLQRDEDYSDSIAGGWNPDAICERLSGMDELSPQAGPDQRAFKRSYFTAHRDAVTMVRRILDKAGYPARIVHSHDRLLDILPQHAGKAAAMMHVARRLGIGMRDIFAAGDSGNDIDMLERCANAIVVANHESALDVLKGRASVHFARAPHASGILEGLATRLDRAPVAHQMPARVGEAA